MNANVGALPSRCIIVVLLRLCLRFLRFRCFSSAQLWTSDDCFQRLDRRMFGLAKKNTGPPVVHVEHVGCISRAQTFLAVLADQKV